MKFCEQLVFEYLPQEQELLVQPNLQITHDKARSRWDQQIDFPALRPSGKAL
jgi:hypothetical protein